MYLMMLAQEPDVIWQPDREQATVSAFAYG
jgi:hypothetical protein